MADDGVTDDMMNNNQDLLPLFVFHIQQQQNIGHPISLWSSSGFCMFFRMINKHFSRREAKNGDFTRFYVEIVNK